MTANRPSSFGHLVRRARFALTHPGAVLRYMAGAQRTAGEMGAPASPVPTASPLDAYRRYRAAAHAQGLTGVKLFLSFDCDTDLDFAATLEVMRFLKILGIKATYAVPGVQIEKGAESYRTVAASGAEFMNHGYLPHTAWREDRYVSTTWYHEMAEDEVEADIVKGDETIRTILGVVPNGFRAPHFGHFSEAHQLALVHRTARRLGYSYCSTTLPEFGLECGPLVDAGDLIELPTFGSTCAPTCVLDSWTYLTDRRVYALGETYAELMCETADRLVEASGPALLTWYGDPSHVAGQAPFERAMQHIADKGIESLYGREAAALAARGPLA